MRRGGRILLFLVVVIVILIAVTFLVLGRGLLPGANPPTATPSNKKIYVVGQTINRDDQVKIESLSTIELPENLVYEWMVTDPGQVVDKYAAYQLKSGRLLSVDDVTDRPGGGAGSEAAKVILPGLVAISMPITRLSAVGFGIRDGDHVNVIATTLFVDLDASFQSALPNDLGTILGPGDPAAGSPVAGGTGKYGRIDLDPTLNQPVYVLPHEDQRPRLVSQMVLQDIQVLHVGTFSLIPEGDVQPTPEGGGQPAATAVPAAVNPDIITLIVTPQDAVSLTYMLTSGVNLTLALRAPDDSSRAETEAATLQYLLSQYAIPVPAKLPYGIQPRLDSLPGLQSNPTPAP